MPLKSYKICSKFFEHGNDPPPLLNDVQKNCGVGNGWHPLESTQVGYIWKKYTLAAYSFAGWCGPGVCNASQPQASQLLLNVLVPLSSLSSLSGLSSLSSSPLVLLVPVTFPQSSTCRTPPLKAAAVPAYTAHSQQFTKGKRVAPKNVFW